MENYEKLSIAELAGLYRSKEISPVEVVRYALDRSHKLQDTVNAIVCFTEERALNEAKAAEEAFLRNEVNSPLMGIPYDVKDFMDVKGTATTLGCEAYRDNMADSDAAVVERLSEAGAVLLGKSNTMQIALGVTTDVSCFGPTRNPRNPEHVAGGSSGGSAASVSGGMSVFSIGTDQGGSSRTPSAFCGIVGLKPTLGLVSYYGTASVQDMVDHLGIICRSSEDCAAILSEVAGYDPRYAFSLMTDKTDYGCHIGESLKGMTFAVPMRLCEAGTDPLIFRKFKEALDVYRDLGAEIREIDFPDEKLHMYRAAHSHILLAGCIYHQKKVLDETPELIAEEIRERMKGGEVEAWELCRDMDIRKDAKKLFLDRLEGCDLMMTPGPQIFAPELFQRIIEEDGIKTSIIPRITQYTWFGNYLGIPMLTTPTGRNGQNLPCSMYISGRWLDEAKILQVSAAYESAVGKPEIEKMP